jgi:hypothetical protein
VPPEEIANWVVKDLEDYLTEIEDKVFSEIVDRTPVLSGTLRDGWKKENNKIINDVPYAGYVENGTSHQLPAAMVATTLNDIDSIIASINRN